MKLSDWLARARAILNQAWDPIGLSRSATDCVDCWVDEYDEYRNRLADLIRGGATDNDLLDYLEWAEVEFIGLSPPVDRARNARVVAALRALGQPRP